jgi:hypothetical protein
MNDVKPNTNNEVGDLKTIGPQNPSTDSNIDQSKEVLLRKDQENSSSP